MWVCACACHRVRHLYRFCLVPGIELSRLSGLHGTEPLNLLSYLPNPGFCFCFVLMCMCMYLSLCIETGVTLGCCSSGSPVWFGLLSTRVLCLLPRLWDYKYVLPLYMVWGVNSSTVASSAVKSGLPSELLTASAHSVWS